MILQSIGFNSIVLAIFALVTAIILASTRRPEPATESPTQSVRAAQRELLEIIPIERHDNDLLMDVQPVPEQFWAKLGLKKGGDIHIARE